MKIIIIGNGFRKVSAFFYSSIRQSYLFSLFLLIVLIAFSGCFPARKIDKWIDEQYGATPVKIKSNDYISIKTDNFPFKEMLSQTKKGNSKWIPALFYYQWQYSSTSTLNPYIPLSNISAAVLPYASAKGLRQKLDGQTVELTIEQVPSVFSFRDKGYMIFFLVGYVGKEHIYVEPENKNLVVSYSLLKGNKEVKKGQITVVSHDQPVSYRTFQRLKKFTLKYLERYDNNIKAMSKELIDKLIIELAPEGGLAIE